jgi:hypothetical protein
MATVVTGMAASLPISRRRDQTALAFRRTKTGCSGLREAMFVILLQLAYIISIGFWARPLTRNETVWNREAAKTA